MVAKITTPSSINKALNYNEKKVQKGVAICLHAANFLKDVNQMNFYEKLARFKSLILLNTRAKTNSLHISLNFHPSEILKRESLQQIATTYMDKIGFGSQPYLVYEHGDAGHPHIHIVTTSICEDGKRIVTQNIGRNQSQKACNEIERAFDLIMASCQKPLNVNAQEKNVVQKIRYGNTETKRSISNVLHNVINRYQFTSLPELNSVLKLYNLKADRGAENSRIYKNGGLVYRILDETGKPVGVPIKASSFYFKPTLKYLEQRFKEGEQGRTPHKQKLKTAIDFASHKRPGSLAGLAKLLKEERISTDLRQNGHGLIYGITFVDHRTSCVFNGSDIGKGYSAAGLQQRLAVGQVKDGGKNNLLPGKREATRIDVKALTSDYERSVTDQLLSELLQTERDARIPYELRKKKRKNKGMNL